MPHASIPHDRARVALAAAETLDSLNERAFPAALVGFDGFIDSIIHMVDRRTDMSPSGYTRLRTIGEFSARCAAAAGKSTNIEEVLLEERFGGNGPLLAGAVAALGLPTTYIGAIADRSSSGAVHEVFRGFARRCREAIPICAPSTTHCLEFDDGKLMFNNTASVQDVTWGRIVSVVGLERLRTLICGSQLIGLVNWSLLGGVPGIWRGLRDHVFDEPPPRPLRLSIDLSDPAKRTDADLLSAMDLLRELESCEGVSVTLGLNLAEAERVDRCAGADAFPVARAARTSTAVQSAAARLRAATALDCVVIHPREGAAAATAAGESHWFDGPFTVTPRLSTGAGDHFNGGFAFAQVLGLPLDQCLAVGCGMSGAYVRDAASPDRTRLIAFLRELPPPENQ